MNKLQFDTHIGHYHSLAPILVGYPLLRIFKIFDLKCHIICVMDTALNLHFIQFREKLSSDPIIFPPKGALTGHHKILFTIEPLAIFKQAHSQNLSEEEFLEFFVGLDFMWKADPDICSSKPGIFFFKPSNNGHVYFFDLTVENNKPIIVDDLHKIDIFTLWNENMIIFSSKVLEGIFLYHIETRKTKKLQFNETEPLVLESVQKRHLGLAVFDNSFEILDLKKNKVIEKFIFQSFSDHILSVSPQHTRIAHSFFQRTGNSGLTVGGGFHMNLWEITPFGIKKRETFLVDESSSSEHDIKFLSEDIIVHTRRWLVNIFKVEKYGVCKIHRFDIPNDYGYVKQESLGLCVWSNISLHVLNSSNFLLLTADIFGDGYNRIEHYEIKGECIEQSLIENNENSVNTLSYPLIRDKVKGKSNISSKSWLVFLEKIDFISSVCVWQNEKVGILYDSYQFYEYDLITGKLKKVISMAGLSNISKPLKRIMYIDKKHLGLLFQKEDGVVLTQRLIVIDLESQKVKIDTKDLKQRRVLFRIIYIDIMETGNVILVYKKSENSQEFLGKIDLEKATIIEIHKNLNGRTIERIWSIGNQILIGKYHRPTDILVFFNIDTGNIVKEIKLKPCKTTKRDDEEEEEEDESLENHFIEEDFWSVVKVTDEIIAYARTGVTRDADSQVVLYNWKEDRILGVCDVDVEEIFGVLNDEIFILLNDTFPKNGETFFSTISIKKAMNNKNKNGEIVKMENKSFGKFFLGFEKNSFDFLANQKQAVIAIKQFFPHYIYIMRKRNKNVELLRYLDKEIKDKYHPYIIKDVVKTIV